MRVTLILLCLIAFQLQAEDVYSQKMKISLDMKNASIEKVLQTIEEKSDYYFLYNNRLINADRKVSINVKDVPVSEILDKIFESTDVQYQLEGNQIILSPKEKMDKAASDIETVQQQNKRKITGTVTDAKGEPIIGANIIEVGTNNGTVTNIDGKFSLSVSDNATIRVSYIGYVEQEIKTAGKTNFQITLQENVKALDEVVVVGYGVQKKVNVIGSIASIDSKALETRPTPNISNMLTGQMSGVTIIQRSGRPGADSGTIRVRGVGSFGATPNPLVLIDGIPGDLNNLNPEDVESISVLKDASSAAIYGSRAANGVILVQTKQGREGKIFINYNGNFGWNKATELPDLLHSYEYAENFNLATSTKSYSDDIIQKMKDGSDPDNYADEMYLKDIVGGKGFQTSHKLSINGGDKKTQYMASFGYLKQDGLLKKNNLNRYNGRINLSTNLLYNLTFISRISGMLSNRNEPAIPGGFDGGSDMTQIVGQALRFPGIWPSFLSDGTWGQGPKLLGTPRAWMESASFYKNDTKLLTSLVELSWNPIKDLNFRAIGGYNWTNAESKTYRSTLELHGGRTMGPSELNDSMGNTEYKTLQLIAEYDKNIKGHDFSVLGGYTWEDEKYRDVGGFRNNYPSNDIPYLNAGASEGQQTSGAGYDWAIQSFFGRIRYNYNQRYLFETTMRYDGSSRFPKSNRFGFFPSIALGWRISEENFFKDNENFHFIDNLKLKTSWGSLGNNNIGNYPYQQVYELDPNMIYIFGGQVQSGAAVTTYKDPKLTWEKTNTFDIGFESIFLNNKLTFNASYFYRKTKDILYRPSASYSAIFGLNLSPVNTGSLENEGWELEFGHNNRINDFSYHINGNLSIINNKVLTLGIGNVKQLNGMIGNGTDLFIGYPMQMYYGYKTDGVFLNEEEISKWADQSKIAKSKPGDLRYVDLSGDNIVDEKDKTYLGSQIPKYTFGINIGIEWGKFDVNALLQGVAVVKGYLDSCAGWAFYNEGNIQRWQAEETWTKNQTERYPGYPRLEVMSNAGTASTLPSDYWTLNGSYLKVRNIQFGYTFSKSITEKMNCSNLRLYFSADNPLFFSNYRKGWDPEVNTSGNYYPILSTYTFGVNINF